ncbi:MAG TPA: DUF3224 domain-containing protein [Steroidobacteraceae bacterium]
MKAFFGIFLSLTLLPAAVLGQQKEPSMEHHAQGTFTVDIKPLMPPPAETLSRLSINKKLTGGLEGSTQGEMFSGGDPKQGVAGYVAIEVFTGTLAGKHGSFALQHMATMDRSGRKMSVIVVPGSGTGELTGISGTFTIDIANGQHSYDLLYTLPE